MNVYKCPVCNGRGIVPNGFYRLPSDNIPYTSSATSNDICRSCNGQGIIYCPDYEPVHNCTNCEHFDDSLCYPTYPPKYRCRITGGYVYFLGSCNCNCFKRKDI